MKALSTRNDEPTRASRPWDKDRDGFVIGEGSGIVILEELEQFNRLKKYFLDLRHIIILPEKNERMIALAHKLGPRFLSYFEHDFNVVTAVLKKLFPASPQARSGGPETAFGLEAAG